MTPRVGGQTLGIPDLIFSQFLNRFFSQFESARFAIGVAFRAREKLAKKSLVGILAKVARNASGIRPGIPASRNSQLAGYF